VLLGNDKKIPERRKKGSVLYDAFMLTKKNSFAEGIKYAEQYLPADLKYTVNILRANEAVVRGAENEWLEHLNCFMNTYDIAPIYLKNKGSLLERLSTNNLQIIHNGPLVSIIMPAWNAEATVEAAVYSILKQTWRPLELIIVDDASTDGTWGKLKNIAEKDDRVKILRNKVNVGPYVSKNIALMHASGEFLTGHDADDWAHPQRIANHVKAMLESGNNIKASLIQMLRVNADGYFGFISKINSFSKNGISRNAAISCMFKLDVLRSELGYWDSVRFGADSEMIERAKKILGSGFYELNQMGMLCLDHNESLTNHSVFGIRADDGGLSSVRKQYKESWMNWHEEMNIGKMNFPLELRPYEAPDVMIVEVRNIYKQLGVNYL
jgi:glycosyltransferase involved in cell wall biosynthesis